MVYGQWKKQIIYEHQTVCTFYKNDNQPIDHHVTISQVNKNTRIF